VFLSLLLFYNYPSARRIKLVEIPISHLLRDI